MAPGKDYRSYSYRVSSLLFYTRQHPSRFNPRLKNNLRATTFHLSLVIVFPFFFFPSFLVVPDQIIRRTIIESQIKRVAEFGFRKGVFAEGK